MITVTCSILNIVLRITGQKHFCLSRLLASERSERDTIRDVQVRTGAVYICIYIYMYGGTCAIIVGMPRIQNVGRVRPQPFCICASSLNIVTTGNGMGTKNVVHL